MATALVALTLGLTPTVSSAPLLAAATVDYLRGTNIGRTPTDEQYRAFIGQVLEGTGTPADPPTAAGNVPYNAGFWPVSHGLVFDFTWNASVAQGVQNLAARNPQGDVIFGMSQGAVVASQYQAQHPQGTGNTFVLVENPARPNGGVLSRFAGLYIPILDITFAGATPDTGDTTVDVARQYDGWADFPTYPLNLLATANAILGMIDVHGPTQTQLTAADIEAAKAAGNGMYYQQRRDTTYYLIRTPRLPLLMPLSGIVPDPILDALDPPLRALVELGYDRTDYSQPTTARLLPSIGAVQPVAASAQAAVSTAPVPSVPRLNATTRPTARAATKPALPTRPHPNTSPDRVIAPGTGAVSPAAKTTEVGTKGPGTGSPQRRITPAAADRSPRRAAWPNGTRAS
ncbi:PE-PPE domain-containing protein [Candidatus Mycolicibacterium alkanivorans]|uniref:PE-PPE domain-containing protein n=1 Tax=Candidatus Mycolicibacterium alkanivorans TaxID=2954114 RepID=A0ABS9YWU3_9MYCO|nr:PE-PPE domain-containing protein [Candidatus Mycolicibacterium alkanivorans]MCI4675228.1 PE-PPE domain-containing protein [Candidatus Mycolicibacterium alkanivorans]